MLQAAKIVRWVLLGSILLTAPLSAGPLEDGTAALNQGRYAEALRLLRPLADQGNANAQNNVAIIYNRGWGVPQNYTEAARWFRRAAEQGNAGAQFNLGMKYAGGEGFPKDYVAALMWVTLAIPKLSPVQTRNAAVLTRDLIAKELTPAKIAEAEKQAREWKPSLPRSESAVNEQLVGIWDSVATNILLEFRTDGTFNDGNRSGRISTTSGSTIKLIYTPIEGENNPDFSIELKPPRLILSSAKGWNHVFRKRPDSRDGFQKIEGTFALLLTDRGNGQFEARRFDFAAVDGKKYKARWLGGAKFLNKDGEIQSQLRLGLKYICAGLIRNPAELREDYGLMGDKFADLQRDELLFDYIECRLKD